MTLNIFLAIVPLIAGWLFFKVRSKSMKLLLALIWFFFLPNTIYLFTDLINLMIQWSRVTGVVLIFLVFQYLILQAFGLITYVLGMYFFEKYLASYTLLKKPDTDRLIVVFNFIIAFGITLGRVQRVNSWDVLLAPMSVVDASLQIISSLNLLSLTILFAIFANVVYFLSREKLIKHLRFVDKKK